MATSLAFVITNSSCPRPRRGPVEGTARGVGMRTIGVERVRADLLQVVPQERDGDRDRPAAQRGDNGDMLVVVRDGTLIRSTITQVEERTA